MGRATVDETGYLPPMDPSVQPDEMQGYLNQPGDTPENAIPATRVHETGDLQDQLIQHILTTLMQKPPKPKWYEYLAPHDIKDSDWQPKSTRDFNATQGRAMAGVQAINAMTGMQRLAHGDQRIGMAQGNLNERHQSNLLAAMREGRLQMGSPIQVETTDNLGQPMKIVGRLKPDGTIHLPDGSDINPSAFPQPVRLTALTGSTGFGAMNPFTGNLQGMVQNSQGDGNFMPMPPAGIVSSIAADTATLSGLDDLTAAYAAIRQETEQQSGIGKYVRNFGVENFRGASGIFPEYSKYVVRRRAALNAYVKSVTGAQFSIQEMDRYNTMFPEPWDPEDVAAEKISALKARAIADMQAKLRAVPGAAGAGPQDILTPEDEQWVKP